MKKVELGVTLSFVLAGLIICVFAVIQSVNPEPERYPLFGLLPCLLGIISYLYVNKMVVEKSGFVRSLQLINIILICIPDLAIGGLLFYLLPNKKRQKKTFSKNLGEFSY